MDQGEVIDIIINFEWNASIMLTFRHLSGCGKTKLGSALAQKSGLNLITCKGPELLDKYIGASEAAVRNLFRRAYSASPALLFFDEFEALAPKRGSDNTGVTDRVVNQLLTFMDGVETAKGIVYILATTTRPDLIDSALLRPGRLDKHIYIGLPESTKEIKHILRIFCQGRPLSCDAQLEIEGNFLPDGILHKSLCAVDIKAIVDEAYLNAIHDKIDNSDDLELEITSDHLKRALISCRPSISETDKLFYQKIYAPYQNKSSDKILPTSVSQSAQSFNVNTMNTSINTLQQHTTLK